MTTIKYEILWETKKPEARSGGVKVEGNESADRLTSAGKKSHLNTRPLVSLTPL